MLCTKSVVIAILTSVDTDHSSLSSAVIVTNKHEQNQEVDNNSDTDIHDTADKVEKDKDEQRQYWLIPHSSSQPSSEQTIQQ